MACQRIYLYQFFNMLNVEKLLPGKNRLLSFLPSEQFQQLQSALERVPLPNGRVLFDAGDTLDYAYFINSGMVSLLSLTANGDTAEIAMVGREGLVGVPNVLWADRSLWRARVQITGTAFRIKAERLRAEVTRNAALYKLILRYVRTMLAQISQSVACNAFHPIDERLARWLLLTHDMAESDGFALTHQSISEMLGVSRSRVSMAAGNLQQRNLIRYARGRISILDRSGLEAASCECYRVVRDEIDNFLAL
jgi:CRP-like cAMP-binding protein